MSAVSEFAAKQTEYNTQLNTALEGISGDVDRQNATIKKLQDSVGQVTPEDQALIDTLQTQGKALADKFTALDNLSQPEVPAA